MITETDLTFVTFVTALCFFWLGWFIGDLRATVKAEKARRHIQKQQLRLIIELAVSKEDYETAAEAKRLLDSIG